MSKYERSGWRDEKLSKRHRDWGKDCPMADIDFLVIEYDCAVPKALVEYKHEQQSVENFLKYLKGSNCKAIGHLGDMAQLPAFVVRYKDDLSAYHARPINAVAREWLPKPKTMAESEWVSFLYRLRGREIPQEIQALLREA